MRGIKLVEWITTNTQFFESYTLQPLSCDWTSHRKVKAWEKRTNKTNITSMKKITSLYCFVLQYFAQSYCCAEFQAKRKWNEKKRRLIRDCFMFGGIAVSGCVTIFVHYHCAKYFLLTNIHKMPHQNASKASNKMSCPRKNKDGDIYSSHWQRVTMILR